MKVILSILLLITIAFGQQNRYKGFKTYYNFLNRPSASAELIPITGLIAFWDFGAENGFGSLINGAYSSLTYGSDEVDNGTFSNYIMTADASTKAHWVFDNIYRQQVSGKDNIGMDLTANGHNLTQVGWSDWTDVHNNCGGSNPKYSEGNALNFDGVNDRLEHADDPDLDIDAGNFSFVVTFYYTAFTGTSRTLLGKGAGDISSSAPGFWFYLNLSTNILYTRLVDNVVGGANQTIAIPAVNEWYTAIVVLTYGTGWTVDLYRHSTDTKTSAYRTFVHSGSLSNAITLSIGSYGSSFCFNSQISMVQLIKGKALSAQEKLEQFGLAKGWIQSDANPTTLLNSSYAQRYKPTGENYLSQTLSVSADSLYEITMQAKGSAASQTFTLKEGTTAISPATDAPNGSYGSYKYYWNFSSATPELRLTVADAEDITFDNIVVKKVSNAVLPDSIVTDYSINDHEGEAMNSLNDVQPFHPYGWQFDGVNDYVVPVASDTFDMKTGNNSYHFWVRGSDLASKYFVSKYDDANNQFYIGTDASRKIRVYGIDASTVVFDYITTTATLTNNTWNFVSVLINRSSGVTVYINAVAASMTVTAAMTGNNLDNSASFYYGRYNTSYFTGRMGFLRISEDINSGNPQIIYNNTSSYFTDN